LWVGSCGVLVRTRFVLHLLAAKPPSDGASDDHGNDGDDHKMIKCLTWKRRKRKTKPYGDQGKSIA